MMAKVVHKPDVVKALDRAVSVPGQGDRGSLNLKNSADVVGIRCEAIMKSLVEATDQEILPRVGELLFDVNTPHPFKDKYPDARVFVDTRQNVEGSIYVEIGDTALRFRYKDAKELNGADVYTYSKKSVASGDFYGKKDELAYVAWGPAKAAGMPSNVNLKRPIPQSGANPISDLEQREAAFGELANMLGVLSKKLEASLQLARAEKLAANN